jgi:RecB family exonuclease
VYTSDDGWEIVDYKSGSARASDARKVQLQAYALAASRGAISARQPPSLAVTFAYFGEAPAIEVTEAVDDAWLQEASGTISHLLDRAEHGPFDPEPSDDCRWCDFLHHCEAGKAHLAGPNRSGSTEAPPTTDAS